MRHHRIHRHNAAVRLSAAAVTAGLTAAVSIAPLPALANGQHRHSPFTLAVLPDSQIAVQSRPEMFAAQTEWLIAHRGDRHIAFPRTLFERQRGFRGSFPTDRSDNTAISFEAGGARWLVVSLKYRPTDAELDWANQVIAHNAGHRVDQGDSGNAVHQIQSDYQTYDTSRVTENSYLRLMAFDPDTSTIKVRTFSPYCETIGACPAYKTDPDNEFELTDVDLG